MKRYLICLALLSSATLFSQVGIGTNTPNATSALDIEASNSGLLIPRVALTDVSDNNAPISNPAVSLLVYNTNGSVTGGSGSGYYYWTGSVWEKLITSTVLSDVWTTSGNAGTDPSTDFIGTTDDQDLSIRTNNTEAIRIDNAGNVGIGENDPSNTLEVNGSVLFNGDFVNQQALGAHSGTVQEVPFTNLVLTPLTGTDVSITVTDGSGVTNSAVFITGFARVFGGNLNGSSTSVGSYFLILQRDTDPSFSTPSILTYTGGACYIETPNGGSSASIGFQGGGHISYLDSELTAGQTYYYRLVFYPNSVGINAGTFDVYQRDLVVLQIKQ
ncbi:hypothetical protein [Portibacter marinus]|uniref:hypothetical protein n=1 Tax=Portibacter marinus TaxID=2898660 RepID=UPI001F301988|nr:hypothetical protein [Portibacter marinus]